MKRFVFVSVIPVLLSVGACGGDEGGKPSCSAGTPCARGSYCAETPDGNVCWPDGAAPTVASLHVTCSTSPCRRDAVLTVTAEVADDVAVGGVTVALDVDEAHPRAMSLASGSTYAVDVPLAEVPFPWFTREVVATVRATDGAGNDASPAAASPVAVTRARWTRQLKGATPLSLSSPALLPDGRIVLAGSDGKLYFVAKDGASSSSVQVASDAPSGAPSVGTDAIWLATQGGKLHEVRFDGTVETLPANCNTAQTLVGPPAVAGQHAFVGSKSAFMIAADASGFCSPLSVAEAVTSPASVSQAGKIVVATGSFLRSMSLLEGGVLKDDWTGVAPAPAAPTLAGIASTGIAMDASGAMWTAAQNGGVNRTTASASTSVIATLSSPSSGAIVLADGSAILGDSTNRLLRLTASAPVPWSASDVLVGAPAAGLALGGTIPTILVPTDQGRVYSVLQSDGHAQWSVELSGQALQPANIWTEPGATTSTAYLAGADGNLYAVVVDGALDTAAPWPKAFHDPRNTSNAGAAP